MDTMLDIAPPAAARRDVPNVFGTSFEYGSGAREIAQTQPRAQLLYATSGLIRVRTPGASWIVTPRRALLMPPRMAHELEMVGKVVCHTLYIDPYMAASGEERLLPVSGLLHEAILQMAAEPVRVPEPGSLAGLLAQLIVKLLDAALCAEAATAREAARASRLPMPQHPRLRKLCEALSADPANADSLEHWAERFGASSRTLARHFQRETGMPFAKWREQMRVLEAMCQLAMRTPIPEVAARLGYADANTFAVMFKRVLNITPLKYQTMMRAPADTAWRPRSA
jgi:AraC-like DNA-binding protein